MLAAFSVSAQSTAPFNPDANNDSYVGATDMLSTLAVYGQQVGIDSSLTCDYDGTPLEDLFSGLLDGTIVLDSLFIQYHLIDSAEVFIPGCPEPFLEIFELERALMLYPETFEPFNVVRVHNSLFGYSHYLDLSYRQSDGRYQVRYINDELGPFQSDDIFGGGSCCSGHSNANGYLPFPSDWSLSENGIELEWQGTSLGYATYLDILPYWHYAE